MLTAMLLASMLSPVASTTTVSPTVVHSSTVVMDDQDGNQHTLTGCSRSSSGDVIEGRLSAIVTPAGQTRSFGLDGSITVVESDGRIWKL